MSGTAHLTRRQAILTGLSWWCLPLLGKSAESANTELETAEIAPGIYVRRGVHEDATQQNADAIANAGFIVGREAVAVVDPGGSLSDGERLRAAIRSVTDLPIRYILISHVHPDHIFGAGAFTADKPQIIGHAKLPRALAQRGEYYREQLGRILGEETVGPVVMPTRLIEKQERLDLGGRTLVLTAHPLAHSDCDLTVLDEPGGTLFTGDLLFVERVPSLDGSLKGWIAELTEMKRLKAQSAVPGHGPRIVKWPSAARDLERYLDILLRETRQAVTKGIPIEEAVNTVGLSERGKWTLFDEYHPRNVTQAFKEVEWE